VDKRKILAGTVSTGALILYLLQQNYDLAQRIVKLETRVEFFFGHPTEVEVKK
jgi:hypothetical protein